MSDTPIHRQTVSDLTISQLEELLTEKRKRLTEFKEFRQRVVDASRKMDETKTRERLFKQWQMLGKEIDRVETAINKADKRIADVRALYLQISDEGTL